MTEDGVKPRQVLKALKRSNPELQSTPRHLYNLKAKIRQGGLSSEIPIDAFPFGIGCAAVVWNHLFFLLKWGLLFAGDNH